MFQAPCIGLTLPHVPFCVRAFPMVALYTKILDAIPPCFGIFETRFGFGLPKGHIMAWLIEPHGMLK